MLLHAIGGLAAGSFYVTFKPVRKWSWETYWLVAGICMWLITPWVVAYFTVPDPIGLLMEAPRKAVLWSYFFGVLWGLGGLTYGLSMRYLGLSLGNALALGACAAFGTIIPPLFHRKLDDVAATLGGQVTLAGVGLCCVGIAICGLAGMVKEKELPPEEQKHYIKEFNFVKGFWIAIFCGIMSACMAFGIAAAKPISDLAVQRGVQSLWRITPAYIVIFAGGLTTNLIWCLYLHFKNNSFGEYIDARTPLVVNYIFSLLAGFVWYCQFMFYGMGTTKLGPFEFSSWTLHMAFIIIFSNTWGFVFHEWRGTSRRTKTIIFAGILVLMISTGVIGWGNWLQTRS